jgi:flagellar biosynthesis protein FliQ
MTTDFAMMVLADMLWEAMVVCAPVLITTLVVGLVINIFQVVTQLQEMTLAFIPKLIAAGLALLVCGGWMLGHLVSFAKTLIGNIPQYF